MNDINLLPEKQASNQRTRRILRIFKGSAIISLGLLALCALVVFIVKLSSPLPALQNQENALILELDKSKEKTAKFFLLHNRLLNIQKILSMREDYSVTMQEVFKRMPEGIFVDSLSVTKSEILFTVSSTSLFSLDVFINNLVDATVKKEVFQKITLKNLSLDQRTGKYFLSLEGVVL